MSGSDGGRFKPCQEGQDGRRNLKRQLKGNPYQKYNHSNRYSLPTRSLRMMVVAIKRKQ